MTRISSLIVATTLAILPLSAFAQQNATPAKSVAPAVMTSATPSNATPSTTTPSTTTTAIAAPATTATAAGTGKTETTAMPKVIQPAKSDVKDMLPSAKTEVHGSNPATSHHAKAAVPAKTGELPKS